MTSKDAVWCLTLCIILKFDDFSTIESGPAKLALRCKYWRRALLFQAYKTPLGMGACYLKLVTKEPYARILRLRVLVLKLVGSTAAKQTNLRPLVEKCFGLRLSRFQRPSPLPLPSFGLFLISMPGIKWH